MFRMRCNSDPSKRAEYLLKKKKYTDDIVKKKRKKVSDMSKREQSKERDMNVENASKCAEAGGE